jgi:carbon-monoxide dehydrogenase large subunit
MLHLAILLSAHAPTRIVSIDVSPALREPGVVAGFSGADVADA